MSEVSTPVPGQQQSPPAGIRYSLGHTWVRLVSVDLALLGATEFAVNFTGSLTGISLPPEFNFLRLGETAWTFTSSRSRRLSQIAPIGGQVLAVNSDVLEDPGWVHRSPYRIGWILCIRSPTIPHLMRNLLSHEPDLLGLERTCNRMTSVLGTALRLPFRDGGWKPQFGDEFNDEEWETLRREFFPTSDSLL
jgi:glycine cleavage system H protein